MILLPAIDIKDRTPVRLYQAASTPCIRWRRMRSKQRASLRPPVLSGSTWWISTAPARPSGERRYFPFRRTRNDAEG